jgi:AcrR family transcriptional regulator
LKNVKTTSTAQQRILSAAVELFSKQGYNGASTRDIAKLADVNEVTVYRYHTTKRLLFVAAVESELSKISLGADAISGLVNARDARTALRGLFELIAGTVARHPEMARLLQFAALEMGEELGQICEKHLEGLLGLGTDYVNRWIEPGESFCGDPRLVILAFVSTVVGADSFYPALWGQQSPLSRDTQAAACAQVWSAALVTGQRR